MKRTLMISMVALALTARADDWPQFMGPRRDGVWRETDVIGAIPASGLPVKWRTPIGGGYSGPALGQQLFAAAPDANVASQLNPSRTRSP